MPLLSGCAWLRDVLELLRQVPIFKSLPSSTKTYFLKQAISLYDHPDTPVQQEADSRQLCSKKVMEGNCRHWGTITKLHVAFILP